MFNFFHKNNKIIDDITLEHCLRTNLVWDIKQSDYILPFDYIIEESDFVLRNKYVLIKCLVTLTRKIKINTIVFYYEKNKINLTQKQKQKIFQFCCQHLT